MSGKVQLIREALANMSPEEIVQAHKEGRLSELLAGREPGQPEFVLPEVPGIDQGARGRTFKDSREWLRSLRPEQIVELHKAGKLDALLDGEHD
jgi:hypothetical protein